MPSIKNVTLTLTEECNLNCSYCYEKSKTKKSMSFQTAKTIIDAEICDSNCETIYLELFGGEPFLEFNLIKSIVNYVRSLNTRKILQISSSTNGTLVHGEIQKWLLNNKDLFIAGLSYDGTPVMQNINRSSSSQLIDLQFFKKYVTNPEIKMTVSEKTLPALAEGIIYLQSMGFIVNCNLAFGINWSESKCKNILEIELKKLINFYINNPNIKPCLMLGASISRLGYNREQNTVHKWCGVGTSMHTYDVDGLLYPCQFFTPLSTGSEKSKLITEIKFEDVFPKKFLDKKCQNCPIEPICPSCYGSNYVSTGSVYSKDDYYCELMKIIVKARSFYRAFQYNNGTLLSALEYNESEYHATLKAITIIQSKL